MSLRVIGGELKGRRIYSVKGNRVRPTADRLRESIFNVISSRIKGSVILDLFAGTGAFGIESLSRSADYVVFVDNNNYALSVIEKNVELYNFTKKTKIIKWNIIKNLNCLKYLMLNYDLVFMDPPYNKDTISLSLTNLHKTGCLKDNTIIVVEHDRLEPVPTVFHNFEITDQREYGKRYISFLNYIV